MRPVFPATPTKALSLCLLLLAGVSATVGTGCQGPNPDPHLYAIGAFDPEDLGETPRQLYRIDPATGAATVIATDLQGEPGGLAGAPDGRLLAIDTDGFGPEANSQLLEIDRATGAFTPIGAPVPGGTFGFDIMADGRGFTIPLPSTGGVPQLHQVDLTTGAFTAIGPPDAIEEAFVSQLGLEAGGVVFINNLGSVGDTLYAAARYNGNRNLIAIDPDTGAATIIGEPNELGPLGAGVGLSGLDTTGDGHFDTLYGIRNYDADFNVIGEIGIFDLESGGFTVLGGNEGNVFSGLAAFPASPVGCRLWPFTRPAKELPFHDKGLLQWWLEKQ